MTKEIIHFLEKNKNSTDLKHDNWVLNNKIMYNYDEFEVILDTSLSLSMILK